jgi:hypothetical protein
MPFYRHAKDDSPESGDCFLTRTDALVGFDPHAEKITYVESADERADWQFRERERFSDGHYVHVPWYQVDAHPDHYAHLSVKTPGLVAYTKDPESGHLDKQTAIKPGRYLERFYAEIFSREQIQSYAEQITANGLTSFKLATSPDDIQAVYENGPRSCMAHTYGARTYRTCKCCERNGVGSGSHYAYDSDCHPVRVYGDSDLAVAYYGTIENPSARSVVWPEKKIYSKIYGSNVLARLLESAGYESGDLNGAKIRAIESNGTYVVPYIDSVSCAAVDRTGRWIILGSSNGRQYLDCSNTNGLGAEPENDTSFSCDSCGNRYDEDQYGGDGLCNDCWGESHGTCDKCHDTFDTDDLRSDARGYDYICSSCYRDASENCAICDDSFNPLDWSRREFQTREANNTESLCDDCAENHAFCDSCEEHYCTDTPAVDDSLRVDFPASENRNTGIYPYDTIPSIIRDGSSYASHCSECNRSIRCDRTLSIIDAIESDITLERERINAEKLLRITSGEVQLMKVYRNCGSEIYPSYRELEYSPNYSARFHWPYKSYSVQFAPSDYLQTIDHALCNLRIADRTAIAAYYGNLQPYENQIPYVSENSGGDNSGEVFSLHVYAPTTYGSVTRYFHLARERSATCPDRTLWLAQSVLDTTPIHVPECR